MQIYKFTCSHVVLKIINRIGFVDNYTMNSFPTWESRDDWFVIDENIKTHKLLQSACKQVGARLLSSRYQDVFALLVPSILECQGLYFRP